MFIKNYLVIILKTWNQINQRRRWMHSLCKMMMISRVILILQCCINSKKEYLDYPPLTPDRPQVKRPPPSLQITSNFLVFYGLSHGITLEKKCVAQNLKYSKVWWTISWNGCVCLQNINNVKLAKLINFWLLTN